VPKLTEYSESEADRDRDTVTDTVSPTEGWGIYLTSKEAQ